MSEMQSGLLTKVAPIVFSLLIGGVGGYCVNQYGAKFNGGSASASGGPPAAAGRGGGMGGMMGGGGMGGGMGGMMGGGGMGGGQASGANALPRLVRNLATIEKVQNKGLTTEQAKKLLPILEEVKSAEKLPEKESTAKTAALEAVLTEDQKQALQDLQPGRGGGMGGMMGGGGMGGRGGAGGGMMGGRGGGMGGGNQDPERPFASERNKQALTDLIASLQKMK